jgi:cytochrome P450
MRKAGKAVRKAVPVTDSQTWSSELNLSGNEFWAQSPEQRYAAYRTLRALEPPPFFEAGESPFGTEERGYYALLRHADVAEASRKPQLFSSAAGATSIFDLPVEFNEYFGSMISMDDPRHARLRRIVSRAFTPKMIKKFEEDVQQPQASSSTTCWRPARATSCSTFPPGSR